MQTQHKNCRAMQETVRNCPVCFVSLSYVADVRLSQITKDLDILQSKKHILILSRRQPPTSSLVTINIQFFIGNITGSTIGRKTPIPALRNEHTDGNRDRNLLASGRDFSNINRQSYFKFTCKSRIPRIPRK